MMAAEQQPYRLLRHFLFYLFCCITIYLLGSAANAYKAYSIGSVLGGILVAIVLSAALSYLIVTLVKYLRKG